MRRCRDLLRFLIRYEIRAMAGLWLWARRRKSGVTPADVPIGYAREQRPVILAFFFVSIIDTVVLYFLIPWPTVHVILLVLDIQTMEMILAILAAQSVRPHVVTPTELRLRHGAAFDMRIPRGLIVSARVARRYDHERTVEVGDDTMSLAVSHQTNVLIQLSEPVPVPGPHGPRGHARTLRIYADDPAAAAEAMQTAKPAVCPRPPR